jgi:hypothetical protein
MTRNQRETKDRIFTSNEKGNVDPYLYTHSHDTRKEVRRISYTSTSMLFLLSYVLLHNRELGGDEVSKNNMQDTRYKTKTGSVIIIKYLHPRHYLACPFCLHWSVLSLVEDRGRKRCPYLYCSRSEGLLPDMAMAWRPVSDVSRNSRRRSLNTTIPCALAALLMRMMGPQRLRV